MGQLRTWRRGPRRPQPPRPYLAQPRPTPARPTGAGPAPAWLPSACGPASSLLGDPGDTHRGVRPLSLASLLPAPALGGSPGSPRPAAWPAAASCRTEQSRGLVSPAGSVRRAGCSADPSPPAAGPRGVPFSSGRGTQGWLGQVPSLRRGGKRPAVGSAGERWRASGGGGKGGEQVTRTIRNEVQGGPARAPS